MEPYPLTEAHVPQGEDHLPRLAWILATLTVAFNLLEGLVSIWLGVADDSVALWGFGFDSFVEVGSALVVLWRLKAGFGTRGTRRERQATKMIGTLFLLLALGIALGSTSSLLHHRSPTTTVPGLLISLVSITVMGVFWRAKLRVARRLSSPTMQSDAACSRACMQLGAILLAGCLITAVLPRLWWIDSVSAMALAIFIGIEGRAMVRAARQADFCGGCGCH